MEKYSELERDILEIDNYAEFMKAVKTDNEKEKIIIEQKSLEKGEKSNAIKNAKNALSLGLDNDTISKITGLSIKEIVALK